jgi:transposase InsO family protein
VSLKYLLAQKVSSPSQHIWLAKLLGFDYDIEYRKGKENIAADALSRCTNRQLFALTLSTISTNLLDEVKMSWATDTTLQRIISNLTTDLSLHPQYTWLNDHLYRKEKLVVGNNSTLQGKLIYIYHDSVIGGHSGVTVTAKRVGSLFYWRKQQKHVRAYVRECHICQKNKNENVKTPGLLQPLPIPQAPFVDISMDFVEGLPNSKGRNVVLVVVDRLSKYAHFIALSHPYTAASVANAFMHNIYKLHGLPASIVNDRDPVFLSRFWKDLFTHQGIQLLHSTAYHPQTDGQTEVVNMCLEQYLRCMTSETLDQRYQWLPLAELWYNTSYHSSIKSTPFEVPYGQNPPIHIPYLPKDSNIEAVDKQLTKGEDRLKTIKDNLKVAQHRMTQLANKKHSERIFKIGDWVYLKL